MDLDFGFKRTPLGQAVQIAFNLAATALLRKDHSAVRVEEGAYYAGKRNSLARPERYELVLENVPKEYAKQVQKVGDVCQRSAIQCMFITQATGYQEGAEEEFTASFWMTPPNRAYTLSFRSLVSIAHTYNTYLLNFAQSRHFFSCDIASQLAPSFDIFFDDTHFNENGARIAADIIFDCIQKLSH